jgi:organic radical activating enzyme
MRSNTVFPIKSETACLLKWAWSSLFVYQGTSASCHRTAHSSFSPEQTGIFHNTSEKIKARELMLEDKWPGHGCEYCRDIEAAGGMSDRLRELKNLVDSGDSGFVPKELMSNPFATVVTPTMLEVYFSNLCNMTCLYCGPDFSTQWISENNEYAGERGKQQFKIHQERQKIYPERLRYFWEWLSENYKNLRMFHVLGGEPFYQDETEQCIKFWNDHPNPDMYFSVFSNLKVKSKKFRKILDDLDQLMKNKKIQSVGITASLDCWGPPQEYVRWGVDLKEWEDNFNILVYDYPNIHVCVNSTINCLSIKTMPELLIKINDSNSYRKSIRGSGIIHSFNMLTSPRFMDGKIFPSRFFDDDFQNILSNMPSSDSRENSLREHMQGIWKTYNNSGSDSRQIKILKETLDETDRRHRTNWKEIFPWLVDVY